MTNVPGLRPFREDAPEQPTRRNRSRVVLEDPRSLTPARLRPTAAPVDTYHRPEQAPADNDLNNMAKALAVLNPALEKFGNVMTDPKKRQADANSRLAQLTDDQIKTGLRDGSINVSNEFEAGTAGERAAFARMRDLEKEMLASEDPKSFNIDQRLADAQKEDLQLLGSNTIGHKPYLAVMERARARLMEVQNKYQTQAKVEDRQQGVFERFQGTIDVLLNENKTPEQIQAAVRSMYEGNKLGLKVGFDQQDAELIRVAKVYASQGKYDLVKALLQEDRVGEDGTKLGSIASKGKYAGDVRTILEMAEAENRQANSRSSLDSKLAMREAADKGQLDPKALIEDAKKNPGKYSDEHVQSLINLNKAVQTGHQEEIRKLGERAELMRQSDDSRNEALIDGLKAGDAGFLSMIRPTTVLNEKGERVELTANDRRKAVVDRFLQDQDKAVEAGQKTAEQAFKDKTLWFSKNGIENPQWKTLLAAGAMTPSGTFMPKGHLPPALESGLATYMELKTKAPALVHRHLSKQDEQFYEAMRISTTTMGMTKEQGYGFALALIQNGEDGDNVLTKQVYDSVAAKIGDPGDKHWGGSGARNSAQVKQDMLDMAKLYIRAGLNEDDAIREAETRFEAANTVVNGWWVPTTQKDVPFPLPNGQWGQKPFKDMAEAHIKSWADANQKWLTAAEINPSNISLRPIATNSNRYVLVGKNGIPIVDANGAMIETSVADMVKRATETAKADREKAINSTVGASKHRPNIPTEPWPSFLPEAMGGN